MPINDLYLGWYKLNISCFVEICPQKMAKVAWQFLLKSLSHTTVTQVSKLFHQYHIKSHCSYVILCNPIYTLD